MNYTFQDHLHNFAVWTAARASQRGFTTTENIKSAIDACGIKEFVSENKEMTAEKFDKFHQKIAKSIMNYLNNKSRKKTSYGRAAKIIAVYLKTSIVIRDAGKSSLAKIIHPPIDSIIKEFT